MVKYLKIFLYIILFLFFLHLFFHIYYLIVEPNGLWFDKDGDYWYINNIIYSESVVDNTMVLLDNRVNSDIRNLSAIPFGLTNLNGCLRMHSGLYTCDLKYWYRCPFCYPLYFYNFIYSVLLR